MEKFKCFFTGSTNTYTFQNHLILVLFIFSLFTFHFSVFSTKSCFLMLYRIQGIIWGIQAFLDIGRYRITEETIFHKELRFLSLSFSPLVANICTRLVILEK